MRAVAPALQQPQRQEQKQEKKQPQKQEQPHDAKQQQQPQQQQDPKQLEMKSKAVDKRPSPHVHSGEKSVAHRGSLPPEEEKKEQPPPRSMSSEKEHGAAKRPFSLSTPDKTARPEMMQRVTQPTGPSGPSGLSGPTSNNKDVKAIGHKNVKTEEKEAPQPRTEKQGVLHPRWPVAAQQIMDRAAAWRYKWQLMDQAREEAAAHAELMLSQDDAKVGAKRSTVLREDEIEDLKRFHDSSLAASTRRAYLSDFASWKRFLAIRFPDMEIDTLQQIQQSCTLEHVLVYVTRLCREGKKISTINRRLSTIKKHLLPALFSKNVVPGSREEQVLQEVDAIIRGVRRTVGAEHRVRGKRPLLMENIIEMCKVAARATDEDGNAMPNTRCRDISLLLFLFYSAMRRNEVAHLLWSDCTFDQRGVKVLIRQSKTDKASKGQTIGIPQLSDEKAAHCPVRALLAWKAMSGGDGNTPVYRWISKRDEIQFRVLIDQRVVAIIKHYCAKIGLPSECFAGHSTRSGYVSTASAKGVPISEMMKRTRHKCVNSLSVYMKDADLFKDAGDELL